MLKVKYVSLDIPVEVDADQYINRDGKVELYSEGLLVQSIYEDLIEYVLYGEIGEEDE